MTPSNILIAGCGYIGEPLALALAARGHSVWGLRRDAGALPPPIHPISAGLAQLETLPVPFHTIFYTAGAKNFTETAYRQTYVHNLHKLLDVLDRQEPAPQRLFFTSSTAVYHQTDGQWVDETSPTHPTAFSGKALLEGEALLESAPFPTTAVRLGGIYGPGRARLRQDIQNGQARLGNHSNYLNLIHRGDCAGVLAHLMHCASTDSCYLATDGHPVNRDDLLQWIAQQLQLPAPPAREANGAPTLQRGGNRKCSNAKLKATGYVFKYPSYREGYADLL